MTSQFALSLDARSLSPHALEDLRRRAVAAVESGIPQVQVARLYGVSRKTVGVWMRAYRTAGADSFQARKRGRRPGDQLALSSAQQAWTVGAIAAGPPAAAGLGHHLWHRQAVVDLVDREFGITISPTTAGQYLVRWGILPETGLLSSLRGHLPRREDGSRWLQFAEILWMGWLPPRPPATDAPIQHVLAAVSNRGVQLFLTSDTPFATDGVHEFVRLLVRQLERPVNVVIRSWPRDELAALFSWREFYDENVTVRFSLQAR
jgi:transposase